MICNRIVTGDETVNHISEFSKLEQEIIQDLVRLGGKGNPLGIVQEIEI